MKTRNSKIVPNQAMKAYSGCRGIAPPILNLGTREKWVVNFMAQPLWLREGTPVPIGPKTLLDAVCHNGRDSNPCLSDRLLSKRVSYLYRGAPSLRRCCFVKQSRIPVHSLETEGSSPYSQQLTPFTYSEPN